MTRPIIGLILDECLDPPQDGTAFSRAPHYALRMEYFHALAAAGAAPMAVPYAPEAFETYLSVCDGWLIPGGDYRFAADWYEAAPPALDKSLRRGFEARAAEAILAADAPLLGVCNGMQVMAGLSGGAIVYRGHGPRGPEGILHGDPAGALTTHDVRLTPGSKLAALFAATTIRTNSAHKEDVVRVGPAARIVAQAGDGVIEAIEFPDRRFAIGVQWHPERDSPGDPLIPALVAAARARQTR